MGIITWIVLGIACGYIAKTKNRNSLGWFMVGLILPILSIIILLLLEDKDYFNNG